MSSLKPQFCVLDMLETFEVNAFLFKVSDFILLDYLSCHMNDLCFLFFFGGSFMESLILVEDRGRA